MRLTVDVASLGRNLIFRKKRKILRDQHTPRSISNASCLAKSISRALIYETTLLGSIRKIIIFETTKPMTHFELIKHRKNYLRKENKKGYSTMWGPLYLCPASTHPVSLPTFAYTLTQPNSSTKPNVT